MYRFLKFLFDPGETPGGGTETIPSVATETVPGVIPEPTTPVVPTDPATGLPKLSPDTPIVVDDYQGNRVTKTMQDMKTGWQEHEKSLAAKGTAPDASKTDELANLLRAASSTDPNVVRQANHAIIDKLLPKPATPEGVPIPKEVVELLENMKGRMEKAEALIQEREPFFNTVNTAAELNQLGGFIAEKKEQLPLLNSIPNSSQMVHKKFNEIKGILTQQGQNFDSLSADMRQKVVIKAISDTEQELMAYRNAFSGIPAAPGSTAPVSVNDQGRQNEPGRVPARLQLGPDGSILGANPQPGQPLQGNVPLPAQPVQVPTGAPLQPVPTEERLTNSQSLLQNMKNRITGAPVR